MLIQEVSRDEIIKYFATNTSAREKMIKSLEKVGKSFQVYEDYCAGSFEGYKLMEDGAEIEDLYVRSCSRLNQEGLCQQKSSKYLKISECEGCFGFEILLGSKTYEVDYLYLLARQKLRIGIPLIEISEYKELKERESKHEVAGLERLNECIENRKE